MSSGRVPSTSRSATVLLYCTAIQFLANGWHTISRSEPLILAKTLSSRLLPSAGSRPLLCAPRRANYCHTSCCSLASSPQRFAKAFCAAKAGNNSSYIQSTDGAIPPTSPVAHLLILTLSPHLEISKNEK